MAKVMFASVLLIISTMSARAIATNTPPTSPLLFSVSNQQTGYFLYNGGTETAGQNVATISSDERDVSTTEFIFSYLKCFDKGLGNSYRAMIAKTSGLYVSVPQRVADQILVWSTEPYCWNLTEIATLTWVISTTDANGGKLDWYNGDDIGDYFTLKADSDTQGNGNQFTFQLN